MIRRLRRRVQKGTVAYVDDIGQIGVKWDTGSSLSLIPGVDSFSKGTCAGKSKTQTLQQLGTMKGEC